MFIKSTKVAVFNQSLIHIIFKVFGALENYIESCPDLNNIYTHEYKYCLIFVESILFYIVGISISS